MTNGWKKDNMTNYEQHLYNYIELQHKSPNRKLLRNWIRYIHENNIPDGTCYSASLDFMMTDPTVKDKTKNTKRNYNSEINKFNEYIYEQEGWTLPWNKELKRRAGKQDKITEPRKPRELLSAYGKRRKEKQDTQREEKKDPEYEAFLEKYRRLTRGE